MADTILVGYVTGDNDGFTYATDSTYTSSGTHVWGNWIENYTSAYATTTATFDGTVSSVWVNWSATTGTGQYTVEPTHNRARPSLDPEEVERRREERERIQAEQEEINRRAELVRERARALLKEVLTAAQWSEYDAYRQFHLTTPAGNRYLIEHGSAGNIILLDENDEHLESLCCHPRLFVYGENREYQGSLPVEDVLVTQVLSLRANEEEFRQIANIADYRTRRREGGVFNVAA